MSHREPYPLVKRATDVTLVCILCVAAAPLLLFLAALVGLTSRGPVIYRQVRLGRGGRPFRIYKFRTMHHDCERTTGPAWSTANDPRVTPPGRFLRRSHLDELPQVWNILKGEMSLVGPRPERPEFVAELQKALPDYMRRLAVAPGLTGLAQVNLPPDVDLESVRRKLEYDLYYVRHRSLGLDLRLLVGTCLFLVGVPFATTVGFLRLKPRGLSDKGRWGTALREHGPTTEPRITQGVTAWTEG